MRWSFLDPRSSRRPRPIHARAETHDQKSPSEGHFMLPSVTLVDLPGRESRGGQGLAAYRRGRHLGNLRPRLSQL